MHRLGTWRNKAAFHPSLATYGLLNHTPYTEITSVLYNEIVQAAVYMRVALVLRSPPPT